MLPAPNEWRDVQVKMLAIGIDSGSFELRVYARRDPSLAGFGHCDAGAVGRMNSGLDFDLGVCREILRIFLAIESLEPPRAALVEIIDDPGRFFQAVGGPCASADRHEYRPFGAGINSTRSGHCWIEKPS
jgi:hypothetical protein